MQPCKVYGKYEEESYSLVNSMGHEMSWYDLSNKTFSAERLCSNIYFQYFSSLVLSKSVSEHEGEKKHQGSGTKDDLLSFSGVDKTLASY